MDIKNQSVSESWSSSSTSNKTLRPTSVDGDFLFNTIPSTVVCCGVCSFLTLDDIFSFRATSLPIKNMLHNSDGLWKFVLQRDFGLVEEEHYQDGVVWAVDLVPPPPPPPGKETMIKIYHYYKTSKAKDIFNSVGAFDDVEKAGTSKKIHAGKGKMRNQRYTLRRGPLVIYAANDGIEQSFRNLPGVELCCVDHLNLLQLAPGGHMGRFCVWSQAALEKFDTIYGEEGKHIPAAAMTNADLARLINSDEIQSVVNPAKPQPKEYEPKANPLRSTVTLEKLDRHAANKRRMAQKAQQDCEANKETVLKKKHDARTAKKAFKKQGKAFITVACKQGDVCANGFTLN
jgi:hypothetical protein